MHDQGADAGGDQAMDWNHVRDCAHGIVAVTDAEGAAGESFNIPAGKVFSHRDILRHDEDIVGKPTGMSMLPGKFLERGSPLDTSKARQVLKFEPVFSDIKDGVADYYEWLKGL